MGKKSISAAFIVTLILSLSLFYFHDSSSKESLGEDLAKAPRLVLEDFQLNRYHLATVHSGTSGKLAYFYEPNIAEVFANFNVFRVNKNGELETLRSEMARAYLKAESMSDLMKMESVAVTQAVVEDNVKIVGNGHVLESEEVWYQNAASILRSDKEVVARGPNRIFRGDSGFEYKIATQLLKVFGPVTGVFHPKSSEKTP